MLNVELAVESVLLGNRNSPPRLRSHHCAHSRQFDRSVNTSTRVQHVAGHFLQNSRSNPSRPPFACVSQRVQNEGGNLRICTVFGTLLANSRASPQFIFSPLLSILHLRPCTTTAESPTLARLLRSFTTVPSSNHLKTSILLDSLLPTPFARPSFFQSVSLANLVPMIFLIIRS